MGQIEAEDSWTILINLEMTILVLPLRYDMSNESCAYVLYSIILQRGSHFLDCKWVYNDCVFCN